MCDINEDATKVNGENVLRKLKPTSGTKHSQRVETVSKICPDLAVHQRLSQMKTFQRMV